MLRSVPGLGRVISTVASMWSALCLVAICSLAVRVLGVEHATDAGPARIRDVQLSESQIQAMLDTLDPEEVKECMHFLKKHMPEADHKRVTQQHLLINTILALAARNTLPWGRSVPWRLFLNDVLPYANLDEPRDGWRPLFATLFRTLVVNVTQISDAAQILNRDIWKIWGIVFKPDQTPEIMSPSQVIAAGYGSCTGLSIFLVNAYRAVGIPARVAGTPSWMTQSAVTPSTHAAHQQQAGPQPELQPVSAAWRRLAPWLRHLCQFMRMCQVSGQAGGAGGGHVTGAGTAGGHAHVDPGNRGWKHNFNNHDWVEVWDGQSWSFVGAAEYNPAGMNRTWFFPQPAKQQVPGSHLHAIYAASFAPRPECGTTTFPLIWDAAWRVWGCDVTQSYLDAAVLEG